MKKKNTNNLWTGIKFSKEEWILIKSTWNSLVDSGKVIIGDNKYSTDNLHILLKALKVSESSIAKNLLSGFPAGTKKYKAINDFVRRNTAPYEYVDKTISS